MPPPSPPDIDTAAWLDRLHRKYHHRRFVAPDPLETLYRFDDPADREIVALLAASLSYGNVKSILAGIDAALERFDQPPHRFLLARTPGQIDAAFADFRYRVTAGETMAGLLIGMRGVIKEFGSLGACLKQCDQPHAETLVPAMGGLVDAITHHAGRPLDHLLAHPLKGSACKRLALAFRWLVRRDAIDPGGWDAPELDLDPARLLCPIDTHMHQIATRLGWTTRKQANLTTALEITAALRRYDPDDPLRFDFALTRPGIRRESWPDDTPGE